MAKGDRLNGILTNKGDRLNGKKNDAKMHVFLLSSL